MNKKPSSVSKKQCSALFKNEAFELAEKANSAHHEVRKKLRSVLFDASEAGDALHRAKKLFGKHGSWKKWLKENFEGCYRTAATYMQVSEEWPVISKALRKNPNLSINRALKLNEELERRDDARRAKNKEKLDEQSPVIARQLLHEELANYAKGWSDDLVRYLLFNAPSGFLFRDFLEKISEQVGPLAPVFAGAAARRIKHEDQAEEEHGLDDYGNRFAQFAYVERRYIYENLDVSALTPDQRRAALAKLKDHPLFKRKPWLLDRFIDRPAMTDLDVLPSDLIEVPKSA